MCGYCAPSRPKKNYNLPYKHHINLQVFTVYLSKYKLRKLVTLYVYTDIKIKIKATYGDLNLTQAALSYVSIRELNVFDRFVNTNKEIPTTVLVCIHIWCSRYLIAVSRFVVDWWRARFLTRLPQNESNILRVYVCRILLRK